MDEYLIALRKSMVELSSERIWAESPHCAFTSLIWYKECWFCSFRESDGHVPGNSYLGKRITPGSFHEPRNGVIRVIRSTDGTTWASAAVIERKGYDLRDAKLTVSPDGRLVMTFMAATFRLDDERAIGFDTMCALSEDGSHWSDPIFLGRRGDWLWSLAWQEDRAYGFSLNTFDEFFLSKSADARFFRFDKLDAPCELGTAGLEDISETALAFEENGTAVALARRQTKGGNWNNLLPSAVGVSQPPYTSWSWTIGTVPIGGPALAFVPEVGWIGAGRLGGNTVLGLVTHTSYMPSMVLRSDGDSSYPGMIYKDGFLYVSYYSSHEEGTYIYFSTIPIETIVSAINGTSQSIPAAH